jgi:hypothetical protein
MRADIWMTIAITAIGVVLSMIVAAFTAGSRYGSLEDEVRNIKVQLARIEGMFELKLRDDARSAGGK